MAEGGLEDSPLSSLCATALGLSSPGRPGGSAMRALYTSGVWGHSSEEFQRTCVKVQSEVEPSGYLDSTEE